MKLFQTGIPCVGEYVKVKIIKYIRVGDLKAVHCELLHYNNAVGLMFHNEALSNKKLTLEKVHRLDTINVCEVLRIDGLNIDLSFKRVTETDIEENKKLFRELENIYELVNYIINKYLEKYNSDIDKNKLFELLFWSKMEECVMENYYYDLLENPKLLFMETDDFFEEEFINMTIDKIKSFVTMIPYKINCYFVLYSFDGITK